MLIPMGDAPGPENSLNRIQIGQFVIPQRFCVAEPKGSRSGTGWRSAAAVCGWADRVRTGTPLFLIDTKLRCSTASMKAVCD